MKAVFEPVGFHGAPSVQHISDPPHTIGRDLEDLISLAVLEVPPPLADLRSPPLVLNLNTANSLPFHILHPPDRLPFITHEVPQRFNSP